MRWIPLFLVLLGVGCTRADAAGLVPRAIVRGARVERTAAGRRGLDWRVDVDVAWTLDRPEQVEREGARAPTSMGRSRAAVPCVVGALCAWERRARARALARVRSER